MALDPARIELPGLVATQVPEHASANGGTAGRRLAIAAPSPSSWLVAGRFMPVCLSFRPAFQLPPRKLQLVGISSLPPLSTRP